MVVFGQVWSNSIDCQLDEWLVFSGILRLFRIFIYLLHYLSCHVHSKLWEVKLPLQLSCGISQGIRSTVFSGKKLTPQMMMLSMMPQRMGNAPAMRACSTESTLPLQRGRFSSKSSHKIPHSSPVRARYGVSLGGSNLHSYSAPVTAAMCTMPCYIGPR